MAKFRIHKGNCARCGIEIEIKRYNTKYCKQCSKSEKRLKEYQDEYRAKNRQRIKKYRKEYYQTNEVKKRK